MDDQARADLAEDKAFHDEYLARTGADPSELEDLGHPYWDEYGQMIRARSAQRGEGAS